MEVEKNYNEILAQAAGEYRSMKDFFIDLSIKAKVIIICLIVIAVLVGSVAYYYYARSSMLANLMKEDIKARTQAARNAEEKAKQAEAKSQKVLNTIRIVCPCYDPEPNE